MNKAIQIAYNQHFERKCAYAAEAGFQHIAVNFNDTVDRKESTFLKAETEIPKILEKNGLSCVQTHMPYYDLRISSEILDPEMERIIKSSVRASGVIGAPWCVFHPRSSVSSGFSAKQSAIDARKAVYGYLEIAEKFNTGIALENLPIFHGIIPAMPFYSCNYYDLIDLVDSFNEERVQICWDFGHANMMHFDQAQALLRVGNRLKCTHVHNNFQNDDTHNPPDEGNIDWASVMQALKAIDYQGPLTLETHCPSDETEALKAFAKRNYNCLVQLEDLMNK